MDNPDISKLSEPKYCVFLDVLGYKALVEDVTLSKEKKIINLISIYENLATALMIHLNEINKTAKDEERIIIKSFSDCIYLESKALLRLLYACTKIYNSIFNLYSEMPKGTEYTPLIRGGLVKDWTVFIKDLASYVSDINGNFNSKEINPIGLGVARAYLVSEKSYLSGMRLIISKEVIEDLTLSHFFKNGYNCLTQLYNDNGIDINLFFTPINENENNCPVNLFELIWPFNGISNCAEDYIRQLTTMKSNFNNKTLRHFYKTTDIIFKGFLLSDCSEFNPTLFRQNKRKIEELLAG